MIEMGNGFRGRDWLGRDSKAIFSLPRHSQCELRPARQQSSPREVEIRQREDGKHPRSILGQAAEANLGEAPQPLDHMKDMLAACPATRACAVDPTLVL